MRAVILAGGKGTRLRPFTTSFPKPLLPVGEMPILEIVMHQLRGAGVNHVTVAVGHLAALIMSYFGDGSNFGLDIDYSIEPEPLGTAGPLRLVRDLSEPFLVLNGDLLTDLDFVAMVDFHRAKAALATVGVYRRKVQIDLGVVELSEESAILRYIEKPTHEFLVSMGVYVFDPEVLRDIPELGRFDLPDLVAALVQRGPTVLGYQHAGYWLDIGRPDDYQRAQDDYEIMVERLIPQGTRRTETTDSSANTP